MKVGDLVRSLVPSSSSRIGVVVEMIQKKCWRTHVQGKKIDWNVVEPEPHAVILFPHNSGTIAMPTIELEIVHEGEK